MCSSSVYIVLGYMGEQDSRLHEGTFLPLKSSDGSWEINCMPAAESLEGWLSGWKGNDCLGAQDCKGFIWIISDSYDNRCLDVPSTEWLSSLRAHVVPSGIGRARAELFEKQITQHGGQICAAQAPGVTHIVVDEGMDCERVLRLLRLPQLPQGAQLVKSTWLSLCLQEKRLVDTAGFNICIPNRWAGPCLSSGVSWQHLGLSS